VAKVAKNWKLTKRNGEGRGEKVEGGRLRVETRRQHEEWRMELAEIVLNPDQQTLILSVFYSQLFQKRQNINLFRKTVLLHHDSN
jgi:hypothetical protein